MGFNLYIYFMTFLSILFLLFTLERLQNKHLIYFYRFATKWMSRRERLEKLGNQPKKFTNVYVKNFGEEMTEENFKELVDSFGKILSLKVVTSDQGRSKGFGFVSFETPEEAQQVIAHDICFS